jgi:nitrogen fixation protein FixH
MSAAQPRALTGRHVLFAILGFFVAVISVNVVFIVMAVRTFPGEDVRRSYLQGLQYNATLAERREQAALGWRVNAAFRVGEQGEQLEVTLRDAQGVPIGDALVEGELRRPTTAEHDQALVFASAGEGRYRAPVSDVDDGVWRLRARATTGQDRVFDFEAELTWPPSR